jgi:Ca2+-binding EF-hand superfamily protein
MQRAFNDTDGDGLVARAEFMARVPDWFAMMDSNGDGGVTTDDFGPGN